MRRRTRAPEAGALPDELAAGPVPARWGRDRLEALRAWASAGSRWSREHLGNHNGWTRLLSEDVRTATGPRGRLRDVYTYDERARRDDA